MPTETLTDRRVRALKTDGEQVDYWDVLMPGLALRVGARSKTYILRYRIHGKQRRLKLGRHPQLSLADARERARSELQKVQAGKDPAVKRDALRSKETTFRALCEEVIEARTAEWRPKTLRDIRRIVDSELLPKWGDLPAGSITRRDVILLTERIAKRAPSMANYVLAAVKLIFNAGLDREFEGLAGNPAHRLKPAKQPARDRFFTIPEIKTFWNAWDGETATTRAICRLALLTGQRVGSICSMRWKDIDPANVWHIPAESFKGRRVHLVPLPIEAMAILEEMRKHSGEDEHVFPGRGTTHRSSLNKAVQRVRDDLDLPSWTLHDCRRTFRTHITRPEKPKDKRDPAGCGVSPAVADAVLGHREQTLGFRTYTAEQQTYLLSEKRDALKKWGAFVRAAVA